jgi:hypothetical protein
MPRSHPQTAKSHAFRGEDPADVAGARADAAEDADLAGALEHVGGDRVRESDNAHRHDDEPAAAPMTGIAFVVAAGIGAQRTAAGFPRVRLPARCLPQVPHLW